MPQCAVMQMVCLTSQSLFIPRHAQELTCVGVAIPYLNHFFELIIKEGEEVDMAPHLLSVSGLSNLDLPDDTLSARSPLSRFILMLDVVLAQVRCEGMSVRV